MKYRAEIDGLRTIAILPVILFHAGLSVFQGGYVGVDIFFVISGYLITSILLREIGKNDFSILRFYERRIRRVLPALFVMMAATVPPAFLLLLPNELTAYGKSLIAVPAFVSNFLFWSERGYFGAAAELKPLVHTWSLAVEEQFYIFFPPLLAFLAARGRGLLRAVLVVLFLISLAASWYLTRLHFETGFYLPFSRIWELLTGAFCALFLARNPGFAGTAGTALSGLGLALIVYAILAFSNSTVFPGVAALVPVMGTAMIILSRAEGNLVHRLLSTKAFVAIGLISYSLYLWHQPIFAWLRHMGYEGYAAPLASLPLVFLMSWLSYRFVETPIRRNRAISRKRIFTAAALGSAAFMAIGAVIVLNRGFENRYDPRDIAIMRQFSTISAYSETRYNAAQFRPFDASGRRKVVIAGDSHARDFYNMLLEAGLDDRYQFSTKRINAECGNLFVNRDLSQYISALREERCRVMGRLDNPQMQAILEQADEVWLDARWFDWVVDLLPETIVNLEKTYGVKVRVFGPKHFGNTSLSDALDIPIDERPGYRQPADPYFVDINEHMRRVVPAPYLTELLDPFCQGDHTACRLFTDDGSIVTIDGGHLTEAGAKFLAPTLRQLIEDTP
ncbi:acyltransferase family protein [Paenirhodobacter populi]|uniref:acyltransferase family protein n=1 Tax=Paenirhodobacter populi TaxID=2306993 RepID=UPI0013E3B3BC|nr:acyltransferase family protein [Sinirhodobacter populi]